MNGEERRKRILDILKTSASPVSGTALAKELGVSRQVIVQDIALLRAGEDEIVSTNRGYVLSEKKIRPTRVFKVIHSDEDVERELNCIVDCGGSIEDVFVYHRVYGLIRGELNLRSRYDIQNYLCELEGGSSKLLKNTTSGYHYHTISADSEEILNIIEKTLSKEGFLAPLTENEPMSLQKK